jgi:hypothetical protein
MEAKSMSTVRLARVVLGLALLSSLSIAGHAASRRAAGATAPNLPAIVALSPAGAIAGGPSFELVVRGRKLHPWTQVLWNGVALAKVGELHRDFVVTVPAAYIAVSGIASVTVADGNGVSAPAMFAIVNPLPTVSSVQPAAIAPGMFAVFGTGFIPSSVILVDQTPMPTTYVSAGELTTTIPIAGFVGGVTVTVGVSTPAPGGGLSNLLSVNEINPVPGLASVSPDAFKVWQSGTTLTVTGSNFVSGSTVYWDSTALVTSYVSPTSLTATAPSSLFLSTSLSTPQVSVVSPAPGGGTSGTVAVSLSYVVPEILPENYSLVANSQDQSFAVDVTGVIPPSVLTVYWNGAPLSTYGEYQSAGTLVMLVLVPAADLQVAGSAQLTVGDPSGTSDPVAVTLTVPTPSLTSASPGGAYGVVGGGGFTLTVDGSSFLPGVIAYVDGVARDTSYLSGSEIHVALTDADVATSGTLSITATNPGAGAVASYPLDYAVGYSVTDLRNLAAKDLVWDAERQVFYANVNVTSYTNPNTIVTIDPVAGRVTAVQSITESSEGPVLIAISDDDQYLYATWDVTTPPMIQRLVLPGFTPDISWTLGTWRTFNNYARAISVVPGSPHTLAVDLMPQGNLAIYDDGVARPTQSGQYVALWADDGISWKPDASAFFTTGCGYSGNLYEFGVSPLGVTLDATMANVLPVSAEAHCDPHYDAATGYIFSGTGAVIDPVAGTVVGTLLPPAGVNFGPPTAIVLDDAGGRVYMGYYVDGAEVIVAYDLTTYAVVGSISIPEAGALSHPALTRWGTHGLAFTTGYEDVYLIQGDFVH